jgi:hypothetical protein
VAGPRRRFLTAPTINAALADLQRLGVVDEVTGRRCGRVFGYRAYLDILNEGTTPLPAEGSPHVFDRNGRELGTSVELKKTGGAIPGWPGND